MVFATQTEMEAAVRQILPDVVRLRHELHRYPEIRFDEYCTSDRIAAELSKSGIAVKRGYAGGTGIVAEVGSHSDRVIAFRADMDGLEIEEKTGLDYASKTPERMHACGHDGHMAMLCGAARILAQRVKELDCTVRFIFQPGEELGLGGKAMVEEGVLTDVAAVFGMHGWPSVPLGRVGLKSGCAMAGADWFSIAVQGKACHGADPKAGTNPIAAMAHVVVALHDLAVHEMDAKEPAVLSVASIHGGTASNSIPETVTIGGSLRTLSSEKRTALCRAIRNLAVERARDGGATASVCFDDKSYMPLYNEPAVCVRVREAIRLRLGDGVTLEMETPSMASEDFSFYLQQTPGAFLWLGTQAQGADGSGLHSPYFDFNDDALAVGIGVWLSLVDGFAAE